MKVLIRTRLRSAFVVDNAGVSSITTTVLFLILLATIAGLGWSFYNYHSKGKVEAFLQTEEERAELDYREQQELLSKVGVYIALPENENPSITTVYDADALASSREIFKDVQNGDNIIMYTDMAIVYRESEDRIITSGPLSESLIKGETDSTIEMATSSEAFENDEYIEEQEKTLLPGEGTTVEIRNGTTILGFAGRTRDELELKGYTVSSIGNASRKTYSATLLIVMTDMDVYDLETMYKRPAIATLPDDEEKSIADVLIILGSE